MSSYFSAVRCVVPPRTYQAIPPYTSLSCVHTLPIDEAVVELGTVFLRIVAILQVPLASPWRV
jgi:nucleotidyltransferase/DNA polymerase involved in DNA repair